MSELFFNHRHDRIIWGRKQIFLINLNMISIRVFFFLKGFFKNSFFGLETEEIRDFHEFQDGVFVRVEI